MYVTELIKLKCKNMLLNALKDHKTCEATKQIDTLKVRTYMINYLRKHIFINTEK